MTLIPLIGSPRATEHVLKRPLDVILSILMLGFLAPLALLIALAIKIEDRRSYFLPAGAVGARWCSFRGLQVPHYDSKLG